jgi:hypothetical protein
MWGLKKINATLIAVTLSSNICMKTATPLPGRKVNFCRFFFGLRAVLILS